MKIFATTRHFRPGYKAGGPIVSISNMISSLRSECTFYIATGDRDISDKKPYDNVVTNTWARSYGASIIYLSSDMITLNRISDLLFEVDPDVIYLNSFFDTAFTSRILLLRRLKRVPSSRFVLAPRGEFSVGALSLKSVRKRAYKTALQHLHLLDNIEWHASTEVEASEIEAALGPRAKGHIHIAPDLGSMPDDEAVRAWRPRAEGDPLRICFLSRVSPMKNLLGAIRAVALMRAPAHLTVYGPKEDEAYWSECRRAARDLPSHIGFEDAGALMREEVHRTIASHDVFFLPSLGENYGHVIPEALSVGLPAVISDRTPWCGLADKGVGYDGPLDDVAFARELDRLVALDTESFSAMRQTCREFARSVLTDPQAVEANRRLFIA